MEERQPKISTVAAFVLMTISIIADLVGAIPFANIIVALLMLPVRLYLWVKEVKGWYNTAATVAEFIPGVSMLPMYTFALAATIYIDRHPKVAALAQKARVAKSGVKGAKISGAPQVDALQKAA